MQSRSRRLANALRALTLALAGAAAACGAAAVEATPPPQAPAGNAGAAPDGPMYNPAGLAWLGLYHPEMPDWMENGNRIDKLCPKTLRGDRHHDCTTAAMKPKLLVITVRVQPRDDAPALGTVVVLALPSAGVSVHAAPPGGAAREFRPDLFDVDWGYGPYFHQTILAQEGEWFRIPVDPLGPPGWVRPRDWNGESLVRKVQADDIVTLPQSETPMKVLAVAGGDLQLRPEHFSDVCSSPDAEPAPPPRSVTLIPFKELFDARGHLKVDIPYKRGC